MENESVDRRTWQGLDADTIPLLTKAVGSIGGRSPQEIEVECSSVEDEEGVDVDEIWRHL